MSSYRMDRSRRDPPRCRPDLRSWRPVTCRTSTNTRSSSPQTPTPCGRRSSARSTPRSRALRVDIRTGRRLCRRSSFGPAANRGGFVDTWLPSRHHGAPPKTRSHGKPSVLVVCIELRRGRAQCSPVTASGRVPRHLSWHDRRGLPDAGGRDRVGMSSPCDGCCQASGAPRSHAHARRRCTVRLTRALVPADLHARLRRRRGHELEPPGDAVRREDALPASEHDRLDHEVQLVDEVLFEQRSHETRAPHHVHVSTRTRRGVRSPPQQDPSRG